mmetsp:Transcript_73973/g.233640  ORF Transcript_73973/g.233640 Transcript_73973/m.233640 type:complete len:226 (+) Transcript_73973:295-972(+)
MLLPLPTGGPTTACRDLGRMNSMTTSRRGIMPCACRRSWRAGLACPSRACSSGASRTRNRRGCRTSEPRTKSPGPGPASRPYRLRSCKAAWTAPQCCRHRRRRPCRGGVQGLLAGPHPPMMGTGPSRATWRAIPCTASFTGWRWPTSTSRGRATSQPRAASTRRAEATPAAAPRDHCLAVRATTASGRTPGLVRRSTARANALAPASPRTRSPGHDLRLTRRTLP